MRTGWRDLMKSMTLVLGRHRYGFHCRATVFLFLLVLGCLLFQVPVRGDWQDHEIRQGDGQGIGWLGPHSGRCSGIPTASIRCRSAWRRWTTARSRSSSAARRPIPPGRHHLRTEYRLQPDRRRLGRRSRRCPGHERATAVPAFSGRRPALGS